MTWVKACSIGPIMLTSIVLTNSWVPSPWVTKIVLTSPEVLVREEFLQEKADATAMAILRGQDEWSRYANGGMYSNKSRIEDFFEDVKQFGFIRNKCGRDGPWREDRQKKSIINIVINIFNDKCCTHIFLLS